MGNKFYLKMAIRNIKKNAKTYGPYMIASVCTVVMFYIIQFLSISETLGKMNDGASIQYVLTLGVGVVGLFAGIFLFYTNSFLIKRRQKEFGLFNILGMDKKHIAKVLSIETFVIGMASIVGGLIVGIAFSKMMLLILLKIFDFEVPSGFEIPMQSISLTCLVFIGIYSTILIWNIVQIYRANPMELLQKARAGEKEPRSRWLLTLIGIMSLSSGYVTALQIESPVSAIDTFLLAVILVMIGTYALFIGGSIIVLKALKKNKRLYYRNPNFITLSGMIYRMKQNAVGLANICILTTVVLIMLSATSSIAVGVDGIIKSQYDREMMTAVEQITKEQIPLVVEVIQKVCDQLGIEMSNIYTQQIHYLMLEYDGKCFKEPLKNGFNFDDLSGVGLIPLDVYNTLKEQSEVLQPGEVLVYEQGNKLKGDSVKFGEDKFLIKKQLEEVEISKMFQSSIIQRYIFVVESKEVIQKIYQSLERKVESQSDFSYVYGFDTNANKKSDYELMKAIENELEQAGFINAAVASERFTRADYQMMYGGLLFVGIFLGLVFSMATALIIYYTQISEGYDDQERFKILQKVGMSKEEVRKVIRSQVIAVFFLPVIVAFIHVMVASKIILKMLAILGFENSMLFIGCLIVTVLIFSVLYTFVYSLTARNYYKIVE